MADLVPDPLPLAAPLGSTPLLAAALLAAVAGLATLRAQPPAPRGVDAPPQAFSAGRARETLARLLGDGAPHPVGSAANQEVAARLVTELEALGLRPERQEALGWSRGSVSCAWVSNILARIDGREAGGAVLLVAHYDSRQAAPGAGDDLAGVAAILEVARALLREGPPRRSVLLLLSDGEEAGLIGAETFLAEHPWAAEVGVVLNLEGRGNEGPSLLFETGEGDGEVVRRWASASERPLGNSAAAAIYRRMPNDTDFTPFRRAGLAGLNFAYIGRVAHYHTALDDLERLDPGSLQHHGEQVLGLVRDLAWGPALALREDAVFFDVFAAWVVRWPSSLSATLALLSLVLLLGPVPALVGRRPADMRPGLGQRLAAVEVLRGAGAVALGLTVAVLVSAGVAWALQAAGKLPTPFVAYPAAAVLAGSAAAAAAACLLWLLCWRCSFWGTFLATWLAWGLGALALATWVPGLCYPLLVPALVAGAAASVQARLGREASPAWSTVTGLLPLLVAAALLLPMTLLLVDAMGVGPLSPAPYVLCLLLTAAAPLVAQREVLLPAPVPVALALVALIAGGLAVALPAYTPERPRRLSVSLHVAQEGGAARWLLLTPGELPPAYAALGFDPTPRPVAAWAPWPAYAAAATVDHAAPAFTPPALTELTSELTSDGRRRVRAVLRSRRGAREAALVLPGQAIFSSVRVGGRVLERGPRAGGPRVVWCHALPPDGLLVELVVADTGPIEALLLDATQGLPEAGAPLLAARGPAAVSSFRGEQTIVSQRVRF